MRQRLIIMTDVHGKSIHAESVPPSLKNGSPHIMAATDAAEKGSVMRLADNAVKGGGVSAVKHS